MLKTEPAFHAFHGEMPITREFRYFVRDGEIEHRQFYWPAGSIDGHSPTAEDWRAMLSDLAGVDAEDRYFLDWQTKNAGNLLGGYWSVDWLWTTDRGWVLTDMAEGNHSFKYTPEGNDLLDSPRHLTADFDEPDFKM